MNRRFPFRGQASFCLTEREFNHRWERVVEDCREYDAELLEPAKAKLMTRWARIPEDENAKRRVYSEVRIPARALPKKVIPKIVQDIRKAEKAHATATVGDGYDCFRKPYEPLRRRAI